MPLRQHLSLVVGLVVPEAHDHIPGTSYDGNYSHQSCTMPHLLYIMHLTLASMLTVSKLLIITVMYHYYYYYNIVCQVFT